MAQVASVDQVLEQVKQKFGFVPNVVTEIAKSPAALQVYVSGSKAMGNATLSPQEQQAVQLAISTTNKCGYCQAAHSMGGKAAGIAPADLEAIQAGQLPQDGRLKAVVAAVWLLQEKQGFLNEEDLKSLEEQGVDRVQLYELIALIGLKTITNYVNHIAHTELDAQLRP